MLWDTHQTLEDTRQFLDYALEAYRNEDVSPWGIDAIDRVLKELN